MSMKNPELVIMASPSGEPLLRGACSSCPDITFAIVGDIEENRRLMQEMFDKHFETVHSHGQASQTAGGAGESVSAIRK